MGCFACVLSRANEPGHGRTWQPEWGNKICPKCGIEFHSGDHIVVDEDNTVYHYDCFEGPKPPMEET